MRAVLVAGGDRLKRETDGFFMSPALFVDADNTMRIAREEIFGPVACVIPANSYEHALSLANDSPYGLSAGICTRSLRYATHFRRHAQSGMVMVNTPTAGVDYHVPLVERRGRAMGPGSRGEMLLSSSPP